MSGTGGGGGTTGNFSRLMGRESLTARAGLGGFMAEDAAAVGILLIEQQLSSFTGERNNGAHVSGISSCCGIREFCHCRLLRPPPAFIATASLTITQSDVQNLALLSDLQSISVTSFETFISKSH